jgi:UDP-N-acetylglucosamine enolpyruvyl transferase
MSMPEISDIDVLKRACSRLGLKLDVNKKQAKYYAGQKMKCDAVISSDQSTYEIAVIKKGKNYEIQADLFDARLREIVGNNAGKLSQAYQIEQHRKTARKMGYEIIGEKVNSSNGNIELKIKMQ